MLRTDSDCAAHGVSCASELLSFVVARRGLVASVLPTDVVPATELDIDAAALWFHATQGEIVMMGDDSRPDGRWGF